MRVAKIDEFPELKDTLAELLADSIPHQKIADQMGVKDRGTISAWSKRPDIQMRVTRLIQERSNRILAQTTKKIEGHLNGDKKISLENLLKIQREFAGQLVKIDATTDSSKALEELFNAAHDDEALAAAAAKLGIEVTSDVADDDA